MRIICLRILFRFFWLYVDIFVKCLSDELNRPLPYSSPPSFAFCSAIFWAAPDTPGTVCDCRKEIREELVVTDVALPLFMIGLFGGIGGGTRAALAAPNCPFLTGGWGGWLAACCTLWARIIVATFDPTVMAFELSCLKTCPGDIDLAIPVAGIETIIGIWLIIICLKTHLVQKLAHSTLLMLVE